MWGQCCPGQISEGVVLWSLLFFPANVRNHKDFSTLRNCHEMKILLKNNSCNMVRMWCFVFLFVPMCFVQCQAVVMLVEQIAHSLLLPCGRSTPEMWKHGRAVAVKCWLPCALSQNLLLFRLPWVHKWKDNWDSLDLAYRTTLDKLLRVCRAAGSSGWDPALCWALVQTLRMVQ